MKTAIHRNPAFAIFLALLLPLLANAALTTRQEIFSFAENPKVTKQADGYLITFTSTGYCDVTIAIQNPAGRVIRHLASGVLGENAPEPLQKNSLSQSLLWDGTDDKGIAASDSCVVKVSLGLRASYDTDFPNLYYVNTTTRGGAGLCVDKDGYLYVAQNSSIRRFSRDGVYNKTLLPPSANVTPSTFGTNPWIATRWGDSALTIMDQFIPFDKFTNDIYNMGSPVCGPDGRLAALYCMPPQSTILYLIGQDGSLPATSSMKFGKRTDFGHDGDINYGDNYTRGGGIHHLAVSPDGGWFYVSGAGNAVLRYRWSSLKGPNTPVSNWLPVQIFVGDTTTADTVGSGAVNNRFNVITGVTCDANGDVFIGDNGNNRIQVYDSNGVYKRTIPCTAPYQFGIHPGTGNLYVLSFRSGGLLPKLKSGPTLYKISPTGTVLASHAITANWTFEWYPFTGMAFDVYNDTAFVWLLDKNGIYKIKDKGTSFEEVIRLGATRDKSFYVGTPPDLYRYRATVDRSTEELYIMSAAALGPCVRINGRTGKIDQAWGTATGANLIVDAAIGPDGLIYAREGERGSFITRYNHDGTPAPFANGVPFPATRPNTSFKGVGTYVGKTAIYTGGWFRWDNWQTGLDVSPTGTIAVSVHEFSIDWLNAVFPSGRTTTVPVCSLDQATLSTKTPLAASELKSSFSDSGYSYETSLLVELWNSDGSEKCINAFLAPNRGSGLFMDKKGALYMEMNATIPGMTYLESTPYYKGLGGIAGSLFKLGQHPNQYPLATSRKGTATTGQLYYDSQKDGGKWLINDVTWAIQDASTTYDKVRDGRCHDRFDLDDFDRIWMPANHIRSVMVYDANGNRIIRLGRYGNTDCRGPGSASPVPDIGICQVYAVAASDEALYMVDYGNNRTLRAKLGYEKEVLLNLDGTLNTTAEKQKEDVNTFFVKQNNPNPFNPATQISYRLGERSDIVLTIYDVRGKVVKSISHFKQEAGAHEIKLDLGRCPSGLYCYELRAGTQVSRKMMALVR